LNKKSWEALVKSGALDRFGERASMLASTEHALDFLREKFKSEASGQSSLFGKSMNIGRLKLKDVEPANKNERLAWEKEHLGMYVSAHPLDNYRDVLQSLTPLRALGEMEDSPIVTVGGIISKLKRTITKKNDPMAFFTLQDPTGIVEVLVFPKVMVNVVGLLEMDKIIQVTGRLSEREGELNIIADEIKQLPNDARYLQALGAMENGRQIVIHMQEVAKPEVLNLIKDIIAGHPGQTQVYLSLGAGAASKMIKTKSQVRISNDLIAALKQIPEILTVSEK
jgi:DNA polymerase-3 subunit alpha